MDVHANTDPHSDCTSNDLSAVLEQLTAEQIRYAIARRQCRTIVEACAAIALPRSAYYSWSDEERALIDEAVRLMEHDGVVTALHLRRRALAEAMAVKTAGLRSNDEKLRQSVSTELIEWELGKAKQSVDTNAHVAVDVHTSPDLSRLSDDELRALADLARRITGD